MGAFRTTPAEPLHQLIAILPIHIYLQMLSKTAAFTLLTFYTVCNLSSTLDLCGVGQMSLITTSPLCPTHHITPLLPNWLHLFHRKPEDQLTTAMNNGQDFCLRMTSSRCLRQFYMVKTVLRRSALSNIIGSRTLYNVHTSYRALPSAPIESYCISSF